MAAIGGLILVSLLTSTISFLQITRVHENLSSINSISVPLERQLIGLRSDANILREELTKNLGYEFWNRTNWVPKRVPEWMTEVIWKRVHSIEVLVMKEQVWKDQESRRDWMLWMKRIREQYENIENLSSRLYVSLSNSDIETAKSVYPFWVEALGSWVKEIEWASKESEALLRRKFVESNESVSKIRVALQGILFVVVFLSLLLLWLGERALRPIDQLTQLVKSISSRGLRKEDKHLIPNITSTRNDEVSELAAEFRKMATTVLEREKDIESERAKLEEKNKLLSQMSLFNETIVNSMESALVAFDQDFIVQSLNRAASSWLNVRESEVVGKPLLDIFGDHPLADTLRGITETSETVRIAPVTWNGRTFGGALFPLKSVFNYKTLQTTGKWQSLTGEELEFSGAIVLLDDLTEQIELQNRLNLAEKLAAVGQMSAQVAHEIRNPLHSIGLEAELALDEAQSIGNLTLKHSVGSIIAGVERLEKITENYLKLSKLSSGERNTIEIGQLIEACLAGYASVCEKKSIQLSWSRPDQRLYLIHIDVDLFENVLGNLIKNAIEALDGDDSFVQGRSKIDVSFESKAEGRVSLMIRDNGPGLSNEVAQKLFVPFVTTKATGTGLGLSFAKKVVGDHGGTIRQRHATDGIWATEFEIELECEIKCVGEERMNEINTPS